jgi:hypothetical protein
LEVKTISSVAGAFAVTAGLTMIFGQGVAAADDYAGQKYSDVTSKLSDASLKGVIASRTGDILDDSDCIVTSSEKAPWIKGDSFTGHRHGAAESELQRDSGVSQAGGQFGRQPRG